ncbi:hypothetical protein C7M84_010691 [Penaeus vannamei]|uniref:Uncharacterized protein n=1 Tax=Penaeus vannamei TaxID=6689 RepID=A0A3R7PGF5_PENVA|nr:hypothetical protein C7M84_010691 [Penaeus vannamei]
MCLYMAIVVYAPALALSQVTGMNVYFSVSLISFVCIFYTTLGGMKAVLWTDAIQVIIMFGSVLFVIIKGTIDMGGFEYVWAKNKEWDRIELVNFDPNPTTRHSIWSLIIGGYFTWIANYGFKTLNYTVPPSSAQPLMFKTLNNDPPNPPQPMFKTLNNDPPKPTPTHAQNTEQTTHPNPPQPMLKTPNNDPPNPPQPMFKTLNKPPQPTPTHAQKH